MKLMNKLKNALFETTEIELEPDDNKVVVKEKEEEPKVKEVEKIEEVPLENDRELFKTQNNFDFPDFDEDEFVTNYEPKTTTIVEEEIEEKRPSRRSFDYEEQSYEPSRKSLREEPRYEKTILEKTTSSRKTFIPSPTISPVYGILGKSTKKDEHVRREPIKKTSNVDEVRKKAFGPAGDFTLKKEVSKREEKHIDNLLDSSIDETIQIDFDTPVKYHNESAFNDNFTEPLPTLSDFEEYEPKRSKRASYETELPKRKEVKDDLEDTLENDLYNLIDAMYDSREDE